MTPLTDSYIVEAEIDGRADEIAWNQLRIVIAAVIADNPDFRRIVRIQGRKASDHTD